MAALWLSQLLLLRIVLNASAYMPRTPGNLSRCLHSCAHHRPTSRLGFLCFLFDLDYVTGHGLYDGGEGTANTATTNCTDKRVHYTHHYVPRSTIDSHPRWRVWRKCHQCRSPVADDPEIRRESHVGTWHSDDSCTQHPVKEERINIMKIGDRVRFFWENGYPSLFKYIVYYTILSVL